MRKCMVLTVFLVLLSLAESGSAQNYLQVRFTDLRDIQLRQDVPDAEGNSKSNVVFVAPQSEPAEITAAVTWQAPGPLPFQFSAFNFVMPEALGAEGSRVLQDRLEQCSRFAMIVQTQPGTYNLVLRINLDTGTTAAYSASWINVTLGLPGNIRCTLTKP